MSELDSFANADFDGSPGAILQFMREMVELTGQGEGGDNPLLELQFDDVITITSVSIAEPQPAVCIVVYLPRDPAQPGAVPCSGLPALAHGGELLWDAGEGRYTMLYKVPINRLPDERSLFDAVLDAKDQALAWMEQAG